MKKQIILILSAILLCGCANSTNDVQENSSSDMQTSQATTINVEETTMDFVPLSEDEYKAQCKEMFYDDFFNRKPNVGEYVKIYALTSTKYKYSSGDMQGILTKDITKQYNLALNSLGCCVLHEETKNDAVPSYFGKHIYIMFVKDAELNLDSFKTGQNIIIYGEIIKNNNGIFVLPKYIEREYD